MHNWSLAFYCHNIERGPASNANLKLVQSSLSVRMYWFFTQISTFACICNIYNFSEPMLKALACWVDTRLTFSSKYPSSSTFAHVPYISHCMSFSNYNFYLVSHIHHTSIFSYIHQYLGPKIDNLTKEIGNFARFAFCVQYQSFAETMENSIKLSDWRAGE